MISVAWDLIRLSKVLQGLLAVVVALIGLKGWQLHERSLGARVERDKITKANDNASKIGNAGASKSGIVGMRGKRDPTTRDN